MGAPLNLERSTDVCIVGAGLNGLIAAKAFAAAGFSVASLGKLERGGGGRTVALFGGSIELLRRIGLWSEVEAKATPLRVLRIIDDTGSLFAPGPVDFQSAELGLDAFGWNIENADLADIVSESLMADPAVEQRSARVDRLAWEPNRVLAIAADGAAIASALLIGADGRGSPTRSAAGLTARARYYPQSALTVFLRHARPHEDVSTEFHTRQGPFTLVPLPGKPDAPHRSSLVWLMSEAEGRRRYPLADLALAREIERQSRGLLGRIEIEGARALVPMASQSASRLTGQRVALVGDAAHAFPPIGAQGLNLGLRDVEGLLAASLEARRVGRDIGAAEALRGYAQSRSRDIAARSLAVNGLNVSLLQAFAPIDAARGAGLAALRSIGPLRRFVMREGLSPQWAR